MSSWALPVGCGTPSPTKRCKTSRARSAENSCAGADMGLGLGGRRPSCDKSKINARRRNVNPIRPKLSFFSGLSVGNRHSSLRILGRVSAQVNAQPVFTLGILARAHVRESNLMGSTRPKLFDAFSIGPRVFRVKLLVVRAQGLKPLRRKNVASFDAFRPGCD